VDAAQTLEGGLRPTDFIGRFLEEEFLAILTKCGDTEAMNVGDRLRKMVHQATIVSFNRDVAGKVAQGFQALSARSDGHKLGAVRRSRQRRTAPDADERNPGRPDHTGARLCRPEAAQAGYSSRSREPANLSHGALFTVQEIAGICAKALIVNTLYFIRCPKLGFGQGHLSH